MILKSVQDTINSSLDTDATYISLRKPDNDLRLHLAPQAAIMQARILRYQATMPRAYQQHKGIMMPLMTKDTARAVAISQASSHYILSGSGLKKQIGPAFTANDAAQQSSLDHL